MKRFLGLLLILLVAFEVAAQQGLKYSQYPRVTTLDPRYLLLSADPGITNYAILWSDLQLQITKLSFTNASVVTTNVFTTNIFATTTFTTNLYGPFITNFLEYSTNLFVTTNNTFTSFTTNLFATTEFVTNITAVTEFVTNLTATTITNNTFITTNVTIQFPGGVTNLNLTPNTLMYADINDSEASIPNAIGVLTNNGAGGIGFTTRIQLDEVDAENFYPTNTFTLLTNSPFLMTDGNGKIVTGVELPGTNVLLSAGANITFSTNGSGGITITGSSTNTVDTSTNNLVVVTNVIVYSNFYVLNNAYITTNFSTNLYFVSGKGNTLIVTNLYIASGGTLIDTNVANNSAVVTDAAHALTNAVNAHGVFTNSATGPPLWGLLQNTEMQNSSLTIAGTANQVSVSGGGPVSLGGTATLSLPSPTIFPGKIAVTGITNTGETSLQGVETNTTMGTGLIHSDNLGKRSSSLLVAADVTAGISPTLNLVNSTNLVYRYTTNALTAITMTFGNAYTTNVSANIVFTAVNAQDLAALETVCLFATNSGGTDRTITLPNGIGSPGLGLPPIITVTNKQSCWIYVQHYGNQATNCWFIPSY